MRRLTGTVLTATGFLLGSTAPLAAQDSSTPACKTLTVAEVRRITGNPNYPNYADGDAPGEGAGGGSSCQYGGASMMGKGAPMLSFVLIPGKNWTEAQKKFKQSPGCKLEPQPGLGDLALWEFCANSKIKRSSPLYVKSGSNDFILQLDLEPPATEASVRPTLIALAKAVIPKLK
jgi:hypothetical protein